MKTALRMLIALLLCMMICSASAELSPLGWNGSAAPYKPNDAGFAADMSGYHDESLDIRVERRYEQGCSILLVYVDIQDASQLRTATASNSAYSQKTAPVPVLAKGNNAVLAINGDFYSYHNDGVVIRNGVEMRNKPVHHRDTLIIDDKGDFTIISPSSKESLAAFEGNIIHAFCFGPYLVKDGEQLTNLDHIYGLDIIRETKDQRLAIGQMGPLSYVIVTVDGSHYADSEGMTLLEFAAYCKSLGCINAYNLDGGNSAFVLLKDEKLNAHEYIKSRNVCDIIFFATLVPDK